jgi:hypothetical protein
MCSLSNIFCGVSHVRLKAAGASFDPLFCFHCIDVAIKLYGLIRLLLAQSYPNSNKAVKKGLLTSFPIRDQGDYFKGSLLRVTMAFSCSEIKRAGWSAFFFRLSLLNT